MSTTTKGSSPADAAPCGASDLGPVAIGDTFDRRYRDAPWDSGEGEPWEVTRAHGLLWSIEQGARLMFTTTADLLDPARWSRARAL